jgi:streptomycin 6-kinase
MMTTTESITLPANLLAGGANEAVRAWTATLADTVPAVVERWGLVVDAPYEPGGHTAWVAPARTAAGERCVLKVGFAHPSGRP